jgi:hypothetical protein
MIGLIITSCLIASKAPQPVLAFGLDGKVISPSSVAWRRGTSVVAVPQGVGIEMDGILSGWMIKDNPAFALRNAITVSTWIKPSTYVERGPGAQILFRGDDRSGIDPYSFVIHSDGRIYFSIQNEKQEAANVNATVPLGQWTHVLASFDSRSGLLKMFLNGKLSTTEETSILPMTKLDAKQGAGLGVGNIQWDKGPHNQPFHGVIADLRLYNTVLEPKDVHFDPQGWNMPWRDLTTKASERD